MGSKYRNTFFDTKREWSKYKDAILDYYLVPYLQKVKQLNKPICVVDMFAGRGEFKTGEPGSPLIIAKRLQELSKQGHSVKLRCYENYTPFYTHLKSVLEPYPFAEALSKDCFSDVTDIAQLASNHTTLLYIDPCDVVQLSLSKLKLIFDKVRQKSSVEAIIVFMARAFMRQAALARSVELNIDDQGALSDPLVSEAAEDDKAMWIEALYDVDAKSVLSQQAQAIKFNSLLNDIAGGDYWQAIVENKSVHWDERCATLVDQYRQRLHHWFNLVEALPVHADTSAVPKYWMAFTSRYEPAFDLFNRAACEMLRTQRQNFRNQPNSLFAGVELPPEAASPHSVDLAVKQALRATDSCCWNSLRWRTCGGRNVGKFTDSEVNQSIKRLLKAGMITGSAGNKIDENAVLKPSSNLRA